MSQQLDQKILSIKAGLLVMLIGPRGGGKTTAADWFVQDAKENRPDVPRISNVPITDAIYVPDILKFLATKLMVEGGEKNYTTNADFTVTVQQRTDLPAEMLIIIDEAAISGFESRGTGLYSLNSYLLALSRKLNVDIILVSQLMSMIEKRGQWLADFYWLCEAELMEGTETVDYFTYKIYDEEYRKTATLILDGDDARRTLFGKFDTYDIPNYGELAVAFRNQMNIRPSDQKLYTSIVDYYKHRGEALKALQSKRDEWISRKWVKFLDLVEMAA
ncbi:MAG: hypothetical protein KGI38_12500 [Thaumarchaeota archaeon]|nr:hypothetical protein [Nitrososphaerota archaeon]